MAFDPYDSCPCGSGKKLKWCSPKAFLQVQKIEEMVQNGQETLAMRAIEKLEEPADNPRCLQMYLKTFRFQALVNFDHAEEASNLLDEICREYTEFGLPVEMRGDLALVMHDYAQALDILAEALKLFPPEATRHAVRTLLKMGTCHNYQGRPLAAWATWRRALQVDPTFAPAKEAIDQFITQNQLLPNQARLGLSLRSPDELAVFNEDRREKWNAAFEQMKGLNVDELASVFEFLAHDDSYDLAAWYNLAIAYAWSGQNAKALEALDHYVKQETNFEAAADAWDLGEILRLGAGAEESCDNRNYVATYEFSDLQAFMERLKTSRHVLVMSSPNGARSLHWMDKELADDRGGVPLIGGPPRQIAQINMSPEGLHLVATTSHHLFEARAKFDLVAGDTVRLVRTDDLPGDPQTLDSEPFLIFPGSNVTEEKQAELVLQSVQRYFESEWIQRPLRSLSGLTPIDAAQSKAFRAKLEGVIRFRERNFARFEIPYKFDRLRNKLGLETHTPPEEIESADVTAYSASQLAALVPKDLSDEVLQSAFQAASAMDAMATAIGFATEMFSRDSLASTRDLFPVFRRVIQYRLDHDDTKAAAELLEQAADYDRKHQSEKNWSEIQSLSAKALLSRGEVDAACERYREIFSREREKPELVAAAVERLLSAGKYAVAREFAELGLKQAEQRRNRDLQEQFREYLDALKGR
ncbi:MAG: hypothetical protein U1D30_07785 [Planctomycetota bacterium]